MITEHVPIKIAVPGRLAMHRAYAHILVAVSVKAEYILANTPRRELCDVSKNIRWDWILKVSRSL